VLHRSLGAVCVSGSGVGPLSRGQRQEPGVLPIAQELRGWSEFSDLMQLQEDQTTKTQEIIDELLRLACSTSLKVCVHSVLARKQ